MYDLVYGCTPEQVSIDGEYSGKISDTDISVAAAICKHRRLPSLGSLVTVTLSLFLGAGLLGYQSQYIKEMKERKIQNEIIILRTQLYKPISPTTDRFAQWRHFGGFGAQGISNSIGWWYIPCQLHLYQAESNQKRREGNAETKYNETSKLLLCPPYLRLRLYTTTSVAYPDTHSERRQQHFRHCLKSSAASHLVRTSL